MVKSELIKKLKSKHLKLNHSQITIIVDTFFETILQNLSKGIPVHIRSLGRFSIKKTKEKYNARNPKTNEIIYVPEKKKVSFKMSKHLKEEINKNL